MRGISSVGVRVIPQLARMGEFDGLFDNKQEVNGDSRTKMVGPIDRFIRTRSRVMRFRPLP
jgi:hypothetical protein